MSIVADYLGIDVTHAPASVLAPEQAGGGSGMGNGSANTSGDRDLLYPVFSNIDRKTLVNYRFEYEREPLVSRANELKSEHSLGANGYDITFAEKTVVDDKRFHHIRSFNKVLEAARQQKDMYGFAAYQDTTSSLEAKVRTVVGAPLKDNDDPAAKKYINVNGGLSRAAQTTTANTDAINVVQTEEQLMEQASLYMHRASEALGLEDVRDKLLPTLRTLGFVGASNDNGLSETTYPQNGPAFPTGSLGTLNARGGAGNSAAAQSSATTKREAATVFQSIVDRRTNEEKPTGFDQIFARIRNISIVDPRDGEIYVRYNPATSMRDLVYCRRARNARADTVDMANEVEKAHKERRLPTTLVIDPTVRFFIWRMPSDDGILNTHITEALRLKWLAIDAQTRRARANAANLNQTVLLTFEDPIKIGELREITDQDLINIGSEQTSKQKNAGHEEAIGRYRAGIAVDVLNGKIKSDFAKRVASGEAVPDSETIDMQPTYAALFKNSGIRVLELPRGVKPTPAIAPVKLDDDPDALEARYQEHICKMVGIPLIQLNGGLGNSKSGQSNSTSQSSGAVTGGSAELSSALYRPAVMKDRADLQNFAEEVLEVSFHDMSNFELARLMSTAAATKSRVTRRSDVLLASLKERFELTVNAAETIGAVDQQPDNTRMLTALVTQFQQLSDAARAVSRLEQRFTLVFKKQKFLTGAEVEQLRADGSVSDFEAANMKRASLDLPEITEADYNKNRQAQLKRTKEETDAAVPTPLPGEGGAPAAKKKKK